MAVQILTAYAAPTIIRSKADEILLFQKLRQVNMPDLGVPQTPLPPPPAALPEEPQLPDGTENVDNDVIPEPVATVDPSVPLAPQMPVPNVGQVPPNLPPMMVTLPAMQVLPNMQGMLANVPVTPTLNTLPGISGNSMVPNSSTLLMNVVGLSNPLNLINPAGFITNLVDLTANSLNLLNPSNYFTGIPNFLNFLPDPNTVTTNLTNLFPDPALLNPVNFVMNAANVFPNPFNLLPAFSNIVPEVTAVLFPTPVDQGGNAFTLAPGGN